ncbi:hypothetical protein GUJ93_ZPchr0012g20725 [Zizania palustris]|uniref:Uncharacterized protein n=1 Tax=Zizania palustris TaxID=103762 RepID=A0A8J5WSN5_ZIZPA|nr:hypothetical protein GUJ93_ZPchr0012g20725 [Zizania palustris]
MSEQSGRLKLACFILSDWTAQAKRWITSPASRATPPTAGLPQIRTRSSARGAGACWVGNRVGIWRGCGERGQAKLIVLRFKNSGSRGRRQEAAGGGGFRGQCGGAPGERSTRRRTERRTSGGREGKLQRRGGGSETLTSWSCGTAASPREEGRAGDCWVGRSTGDALPVATDLIGV